MFWKYIEKINWDKQIQHIPFLKNKQLYINIEYKGYTWECGLKWRVDTCFAARGWWLCFTIIGILFEFNFFDKRWYNENEDRFYLEDEPRWVDYSDSDYLQRVRAFMEKHPELKEGYYERVLEDMEENIKSDEAFNSPTELKRRKRGNLHEKYVQAQSKILLTKLPMPLEMNKIYKATRPQRDKWPWRLRWKWWLEHKIIFTKERICLNFGPIMTYVTRWDGELLSAETFYENFPGGRMAPIYFLPEFNLYDEKGNLLSKATDYEVRPPWDIYDTGGNLLYKDKYSSWDIGK